MTSHTTPEPGTRQVSYLHEYSPRYLGGSEPHRTTSLYLALDGFGDDGFSRWREVARHTYPTYRAALMATDLYFAGVVNFTLEDCS